MGFVDPNTIDTPTTGNVAPAAWGTAVRTAIMYLADTGPRCRVRLGSVQAITTGGMNAVLWDTEDYDNDTMHDTVSNKSRLTATTAGKYKLTAYCEFAAAAGAYRIFQVSKNGTVLMAEALDATAAGMTTFNIGRWITWEGQLAAADYLEISVYQSTGSNLNLNTTSYAALRWVGVY